MNGAELPGGTILRVELATTTTTTPTATTTSPTITHLPLPPPSQKRPELVVDAIVTNDMEVARISSSTTRKDVEEEAGPSRLTNTDSNHDKDDDDNDDLDEFFDSL